jgi:hypothetical protein
MAATALTVADVSRTGLAYAPAAANADGHLLPNTGKEFLAIVNADSGAHVVSAAIVRTVDGVTPAAKTLSVPAGATRLWGPFAREDYNNGAGQVAISFDGVTGVTVQAVRLVPV